MDEVIRKKFENNYQAVIELKKKIDGLSLEELREYMDIQLIKDEEFHKDTVEFIGINTDYDEEIADDETCVTFGYMDTRCVINFILPNYDQQNYCSELSLSESRINLGGNNHLSVSKCESYI